MIKIIMKASKVSKRNMNKSLNIVKKFMKMLKTMLTDREKSIKEMASWSNIFCDLGQFSSVVKLIIDFLTSGLSCWGRILWCSGGLLCFIFICQVIWDIFEIFAL